LGAATGESDFPQPDTVKARASRSDAEKLRATAGKRKTQEEGMTHFLEGAAPSQDAAVPVPPRAPKASAGSVATSARRRRGSPGLPGMPSAG
jgi:hypothetical protein